MNKTVQTEASFRTQALKALAMDLALFAVLVLVSEIVLRFFAPSVQNLIYTENKTGGHPVVLNSAKLRDTETAPDFPLQGIRIILLGNSVTCGSGLAGEDTFAKQLGAMLQRREDRVKYDVVNAGGQ